MSKKLMDNAGNRDNAMERHSPAAEQGPGADSCACRFGGGPGQHVRLNALLEQMAAAISTLNAPAGVRNRCLSEARLRMAESWRLPQLRRLSGARLRTLGLGAAGLVAAAAVCCSLFVPGGFSSIARLLPGGSQPSATASPDLANDALAGTDGSAAASSADYVSLPYSDPSIVNGTETTVEVTMPVSQLMAWGVPAPGRGPDEVIPVDLVLGDDGLPRAVQVLPATSSISTAEELYP